MKESTKYHPLFVHLRNSDQDELSLTFSAIEVLLGENLPASARTKQGWWSNRRKGAVQAAAWMAAGYQVDDVDLEVEEVTFRKPGIVYKIQRRGENVVWDADLVKALRHYMGMNQAQFADELGIRQPTVSEWETGAYEPRRSSSKLLTLIAERAGFHYK